MNPEEELLALRRLPPGFRSAVLALYRHMESHPGGRFELTELRDGRLDVSLIERKRIHGRGLAPGEEGASNHVAVPVLR